MRSIKSFKNVTFSIISNIFTILIGFVIQAVFIRTLGEEYLGLNGLFTNIVSMLTIVELGIGSAIIYKLYKPIAVDDKEKIKTLMNFYKKCYRIIAIAIFIIGLLLIPFLPVLVGENSLNVNITIIYILFLLDSAFIYVMSYKRSIIYVDQKNYLISIVHIVYLIVMNSLLLLILFTNKNYYLYLIIKIVMRFIENMVISFVANKKYPYIKDKNVLPIDKITLDDIKSKVKGLIFHKAGAFIVLGTDNIIISTFLGGVKTVGYYANYNTIIYAVSTMLSQGFEVITASVGNLLVTTDNTKRYDTYKKLNFMNFWIAGFTATCIFVIMDSFIKVWVGEKYILSFLVLLMLTINYYFTAMRCTITSFKEASGTFYEDRFVPFIESLVNIVFSIVLLKYFGLAGVFMGTILSSLVLHLYSYPKFVYLKLFDSDYKEYIFKLIKQFLIFITIMFITYFVASNIVVNSGILQIIINALVCGVITNILYYLIFRKTEEFNYFLDFTKKMLRRKRRG